jgi:hypothetical protein
MTGCACSLIEVVQRYFCTECGFVTFGAGNGFMSSRKREDGLLVFCKSVVRRFECCSVVASLAAIVRGWIRKLPLMLIVMAIDATGKLDLEARILAGWCVT